MAIGHVPAARSLWQSSRSELLLIAALLLVLVGALVLAAYTPWVLDQAVQPYDWTTMR